MIKELNKACEKMNHIFGVSVKLPNPEKENVKSGCGI